MLRVFVCARLRLDNLTVPREQARPGAVNTRETDQEKLSLVPVEYLTHYLTIKALFNGLESFVT